MLHTCVSTDTSRCSSGREQDNGITQKLDVSQQIRFLFSCQCGFGRIKVQSEDIVELELHWNLMRLAKLTS